MSTTEQPVIKLKNSCLYGYFALPFTPGALASFNGDEVRMKAAEAWSRKCMGLDPDEPIPQRSVEELAWLSRLGKTMKAGR